MKYNHNLKNDEFVDKFIYKQKKNGYFIEIGACDGIHQSQCYYFEKYLNWNGVAVEPQERYYEQCGTNRKTFCNKCIGDKIYNKIY